MTFTISGTPVSFLPGQSILDALRSRAGLPLQAPCGGRGSCGKCTVYLLRDGMEQPVLACQTPAEEGMVLRLPEGDDLLVEASAAEGPLVTDGLGGYGIACDIGTTTVACQLLALSSGQVLGTLGRANAQAPWGADVVSRIHAANVGALPQLTAAIRGQLSEMISRLAEDAGVPLSEISAMTVAANTTMCHLLTGLSPEGLGKAPYTPASLFGDWVDANDLDLPFAGKVYICPAVAGYVGGDITAGLLAADADRRDGPILLLDVGTNGEMALGCGETFLCCATAAGPAFEGAQIRFGMTAAPGAISRVEWNGIAPVCEVIGGGKARGICGSGLMDAMAMLLSIGAVDETGYLLQPGEDDIPPKLEPYLCAYEDSSAFHLSGGVFITQQDIRQLQLAKAAMAAGIRMLRQAANFPELQSLLLAGGFGSRLRPESAAAIGLIPEDLLSRTTALGNAALKGAGMALLSQTARDRLAAMAADYLELATAPAFSQVYVEEMSFPET